MRISSARSFSTSETVARDTPASSATSALVALSHRSSEGRVMPVTHSLTRFSIPQYACPGYPRPSQMCPGYWSGGGRAHDRLGEKLGIDIAARRDGDHGLAGEVGLLGEHGRDRGGAARLDDELEMLEQRRHRRHRLVIRHGKALGAVRRERREG